MNTTTTLRSKNIQQSKTVKENIIDFYNKATEDYEFWSKDLNMHFGYYIPFKTNLLKRDTMLNTMNEYIFSRLKIEDTNAAIVDLGCGMGATMKFGIEKYPNITMRGFTISDFQVEYGNQLINSERGLISNKDYRKTELPNNYSDGVYAIESFCHSGCSKESLQEAYRILKPNSRLVIADAFCKRDRGSMNLLSQKVHDGLAKSWSLEKLGNIREVKKQLREIGFKEVEVKNIWYRVAPSVLHVPFAITGFMLKKLINSKSLTKESIDNLKGSFYALLTGLCLPDFGYYIITAKK